MWLAFALIPPGAPVATPAASPGASPPGLRTIVTVKSTPFCNAVAQHFNDAFTPMFDNDRTLDRVDGELGDVTNAFSSIDYVQAYMKARERLARDVKRLNESMGLIQGQIDAFRASEKLTTDPDAAKGLRDAAGELQQAYKKQYQLSFDLQSLLRAMYDYNPADHPMDHPVGGYDPQASALPADMKDIRKYLRFEGQRDVLRTAETKAVDLTYDLVNKSCTTKQ